MSSYAEDRSNELWRRVWPKVALRLDRFLRTDCHQRDRDELRRARLIVGLLGLTLATVPIPAIDHWLAGLLMESGVLAGTWLAVLALLIGLRNGLSSTVAGHGVTVILFATVALNAVPLGGVHSPPAVLAAIVPLLHTLVVRGSSNWLWCAVGIGLLVVLDGLTGGSVAEAHQKTIALIGVTVVLTGMASLFEVSRRDNIEELWRARRKAEAGAEAKSRFLANMSHEIRTPLNGVLGMLGLLLEERLPKHQYDYARTAHSSGVILLDLINDILDFSKIEAGQMLLEATPFDLRALAEDVLDQVALLADGKGVELISRYVPLTPTHVVGDPGRIRQILLNLVNNAVKFTEDGHVLVTIEEVESQGEQPVFRCSVEDTGIGIEPAQQARVFEHFQQVDASPSRVHAGTGLGLAIVRELASLMKGRVGLTSEAGKGSTFWFELPLPVARVPTESRPESLCGLKVLVVDDNRVNRWVLREQLARWQFRLEEAASGSRALEFLREAAARGEPFDIALLDYHMPRMDGLELTRTIKADSRIRDTRLVMLSSVTERSGAQRLLEAGCAAYLIKPVHQSDLMNTLANVWAERGLGPVASTTSDEPMALHELGTAVARGSRILVVEDNAINQKVAVRMLSTLGAHVDVAGDGLEALVQLEAFPYDLVFMDVQMPRMDGLEATMEIRRRERSKGERVAIVAMTAHAQSEDRDRCLESGMDGYVRKPITRRELIRTLREFLEPPPDLTDVPIAATTLATTAPIAAASVVTTPFASAPVAITRVVTAPVAARSSGRGPCDLQWLRSNYDADDQVVKELLGLFMRRASELLVQMKVNLAAEDDEAFGRSVHALKGLCGTVRANPMYVLASGEPAEVARQIPELERAYVELRMFFADALGLEAPPLQSAQPEGGTQALPSSSPT